MTNENCTTAIIHDRLNTYGGGERVVNQLAKTIPGTTDIITGEYDKDSTYNFSNHDIIELDGPSFASFIRSRLTIEWKEYDLVIFSGNRPQFVQWSNLPVPTIRYCHSPTRTFWSLRDQDFRNANPKEKISRMVIAPIYRQIDKILNNKHSEIITNSHNIRSQVKRFYGVDATVVYPPTKIDEFEYSSPGDYWLSVNRLVPKKRIDLQIDAFEGASENLVIVGSVDERFSDFGKRIKSRVESLPNIRIEEEVPQEQLVSLYSNTIGVLYTPIYEDFGIVPVEAMASGKPVIAVAEGGPIETVQDQRTGWLVAPDSSEIQQQVRRSFDAKKFRSSCLDRARQFSEKRFKSKIHNLLESNS